MTNHCDVLNSMQAGSLSFPAQGLCKGMGHGLLAKIASFDHDGARPSSNKIKAAVVFRRKP
ncbi:MAG: hypothetical protein EBT35_08040 [Alphaproteobacteria bacterium]|nr:hypothetical protein [Alphaproteobacteria bacterium]